MVSSLLVISLIVQCSVKWLSVLNSMQDDQQRHTSAVMYRVG